MAETYISYSNLYGSMRTDATLIEGRIASLSNSDINTLRIKIGSPISEFTGLGPNKNPISLLGKEVERALYPNSAYHMDGDTIFTAYNNNVKESNTFTQYSDNDKFRISKSTLLTLADPYGIPYSGSDEYKFTEDSDFVPLNSTSSVLSENEYGEYEAGANSSVNAKDYTGSRVYSYESFPDAALGDVMTLIKKTNAYFRQMGTEYISKRYQTIISRFHTDTVDPNDESQTAISNKYGMSHGRNLQKMEPDKSQGYDNPYCRVWTYHHQYHRLHDAIRPFVGEDDTPYKQTDFYDPNQYNWAAFRSPQTVEINKDKGIVTTAISNTDYSTTMFSNGAVRLSAYGAMYNDDRSFNNGLVNITPILGTGKPIVSLKHCMFSIENLAWRGQFDTSDYDRFQSDSLSPEQKGPLGGRIMWFPPYDIKFNENVSANWNQTEFIGRGESIYTYSNTSREGTLSFKLLIDHPAILDYWEGRKLTNSKYTDSDDIDDLYSKENHLLRFFAGCEVLKAFSKAPSKPVEVPEPKPVQPTSNLSSIQFFVFYPNNYTGFKDMEKQKNDNGRIDAMEYLLNGFGSQRAYYTTSDGKGHIADIPTTLDEIEINGNIIGGYEIRDKGISIVSKPSEAEVGPFGTAGFDSKDRIVVSTVNYNNTPYTLNGNNVYPAKLVGTKALKYTESNNKRTTRKGGDAWFDRRWYYRVDTYTHKYKSGVTVDIPNEKLSGGHQNYIDGKSYHLNSTGYTEAFKTFKISDEKTTYSFAEMFLAFSSGDDYEKAKKRLVDSDGKALYRQEAVDEIKNVLKGQRGQIKSISIKGWASSHGTTAQKAVNQDRNAYLSEHRARTLSYWFRKHLANIEPVIGTFNAASDPNGMEQEPSNEVEPGKGSGYVDELHSKLHRSAFIEIFYDPSTITDTTTNTTGQKAIAQVTTGTEASVASTNATTENSSKLLKSVTTILNDTLSKSVSLTKPVDFDAIKNSVKEQMGKDGIKASNNTASISYTSPKNLTEEKGTESAKNKNKVNSQTDNSQKQSNVTKNNKAINEEWSTAADGTRYDNEARFFEQLTLKDPFITEKLREKIKYFNPAFHSMSPEGFNARLTFLQQCTRQGPTIGGSDFNSGKYNADNLAFGRPPVCVLRVGDFYNTKIIIRSLNIDYNPLTWDLNEEGIGVMPMIADVSITFAFIGGSDLGGPIQRLQNALSFNYYANTSVYDNRAEEIRYAEHSGGKVAKFKPFLGNAQIQSDAAATEEKKETEAQEKTAKGAVGDTTAKATTDTAKTTADLSNTSSNAASTSTEKTPAQKKAALRKVTKKGAKANATKAKSEDVLGGNAPNNYLTNKSQLTTEWDEWGKQHPSKKKIIQLTSQQKAQLQKYYYGNKR
jgi:hypothetical protein